MPELEAEAIGLVGGTGPLGRGLALRLAVSGLDVRLGSRDQNRGLAAADALNLQLPTGSGIVSGLSNHEVVARTRLVILTIPYEAMASTLSDLKTLTTGRIMVSTAVPMAFLAGVPYPAAAGARSATEEVSQLCPDSVVVGAFHTVAAGQLLKLAQALDEDVLLTSDDAPAKTLVGAMVERIPGLRAVDAGPLSAAGFCERLTPFLLRLNRLHRAHTGIRITGL